MATPSSKYRKDNKPDAALDYFAMAVAGPDGIVPINNPNSRHYIWSIDDIYFGGIFKPNSNARYVPKVRDYVVNPNTHEWHQVTKVDPVTWIPTLVKIGSFSCHQDDLIMDEIAGLYFDSSRSYRLYINDTVIPHTIKVDDRIPIDGNHSDTAIIFKWSPEHQDIPISKYYDVDGTLLGNTIKLTPKASSVFKNHSIVSVPMCYSTDKLDDGEWLKLITYNKDNVVTNIFPLVAVNTGFLPTPDTTRKYVMAISLDSVFLSELDEQVIQIPLNTLRQDIQLYGIVTYSDGTSRKLPVDGSQFQIHGLEAIVINNQDYMVNTVLGASHEIVLTYRPGPNEPIYGPEINHNDIVTRKYYVEVTEEIGAYNVKLFGYPRWVNNYYRMEWFLLNGDRTAPVKVTEKVYYNNNTTFDGTRFEALQNLSAAVNLNDVNPLLKDYVFTQTQYINLQQAATFMAVKTPWYIQHFAGQSPAVGSEARMLLVNSGSIANLTVSGGTGSIEAFLDKFYYPTRPMYNPRTESIPVPDGFAILNPEGTWYHHPITSYQTIIRLPFMLLAGETVFIAFTRRKSGGEYEWLSIVGASTTSVAF